MWILLIALFVLVVAVMTLRLGLVDSLDFGAGSYYYADIPEFERFFKEKDFSFGLSVPVAIILFLAWGALMYMLWVWIDKRK